MSTATPESAAYFLMERIYNYESEENISKKTREYTLDLYAECLEATTGKRKSKRMKAEEDELASKFDIR
jgi:hypothetical protein